jgi:rhamnosyl/mannosyltransferase
MKVLHIYKDYFPPVVGGIEGHLNLLANGLKNADVDVELLTSNTKSKLERNIVNGIPITKVPQLGRFNSAPINFTLPYWIRKIGEKSDILHFHYPNPSAELAYLCSGLRNKVVVTYHSDIVRQRISRMLLTPFLRSFLQCAHTIIVSSPNYQRSSTVLQKLAMRCTIIPYGIDLGKFSASSETDRKASIVRRKYGRPILLFVGKFRYYKGLHVLIDAAEELDCQVLLIGTGPLEPALRMQVERNNLDAKVKFIGEVSDDEKVTFMHACDVFVLPSIFRSEAFGIAQLEAMSCGKPIISTELHTGTSFVNRHLETGLVVPPNNVEALADAVKVLIDNPEMKAKYGNACLERVKKFFGKEKMIASVLNVYRDAIK